MAQDWVTGPALIFAGVGGGPNVKAPLFVGVAEDSPEIDEIDEYEPVWNALGGCRIPYSKTWQGQHAVIRADLTVWNQATLNLLAARPDPSGTPGSAPFGSLGALMVEENLTYPLWLKFPYSPLNAGGKTAMTGMMAGYRYVAVTMEGPERLRNLNTRARKISLVWHAERVFDWTSGSWSLYDHNLAGLPPAA